MQSIDAVKSIPVSRSPRAADPGPPPSPRATGRSMDGFMGVRPVAVVPKVAPAVRVTAASANPDPRPLQETHRTAPQQRPSPVPSPARSVPTPAAVPPLASHNKTAAPRIGKSFSFKKKPASDTAMSTKRKILLVVGLSLSILLLAFLGVFPAAGQVVLLVYGLAALIFKVESRITFGFALAALALIPVSQVLNAGFLAESYAIFAYLLLFSGTVSLAFELWRGRKFKLSTP